MAKKAVKPKTSKPKPQPNAEALARLNEQAKRIADERRRILGMPAGSRVRSREIEDLFIEQLAKKGIVSDACSVAGIEYSTAYAWRKASQDSVQEDGSYKDDFSVRWINALERAADGLEQEARRRAVEGVEKPVYQGGVLVGSITEYSDSLMQTMLRAKRPTQFNTDRVEHTGKDGGPIVQSIAIEFVDKTTEPKK